VFIEGAETEDIDDNTHHPLNIHKNNCTNVFIAQTNVHQLTANSPIINTPM
jgi:hypothetical protein